MLLHSLIRQLDPQISLSGIPADLEVTGVREDSRLVRPGDVFVARQGTKEDGSRFVLDAHRRGAVAAVVPARVPEAPLIQFVAKDPASATSVLANAFFGQPAEKVRVLSVTGTNGKTTTTYLIRHLLINLLQSWLRARFRFFAKGFEIHRPAVPYRQPAGTRPFQVAAVGFKGS